MSQLFASGGQRTGTPTSASVLPMNIQDWFPLGLTGLLSLQSKRLSRVFSNTTVWKHQFFSAQPSLWSSFHIHTWLLEKPLVQFSSVTQLCLTLRPQGLQHARLPCPSSILGAYANSCPLSWWCHPTISSSVVPFSSHLQSFPASGSFKMSQFITSSGQSVGVSASASVLPMDIQGWFPLELTGWIFSQSKGIALTTSTFVHKMTSLFFNMLSMLVITFLPRSKHLLWLQLPATVILECDKIKSVTIFIVSPTICCEVMGQDAMIFVFWMLSFKPGFWLSSFTFIKRLFSSSSLSAIRVMSSAYLICNIIDISPGNLDSVLCFIQPGILHDVLCIEVK